MRYGDGGGRKKSVVRDRSADQHRWTDVWRWWVRNGKAAEELDGAGGRYQEEGDKGRKNEREADLEIDAGSWRRMIDCRSTPGGVMGGSQARVKGQTRRQ